MTNKIFGPFRLTVTDADPGDHTAKEKETVLLHAIYDCFPPPESHGFVERPDSVPPENISRFLRRQEAADLLAFTPPIKGQAATIETAIDAILAKLDIGPLDIFYVSDDYKPLLTSKPCYKATIYIRIRNAIKEIKIAANEGLGKAPDAFAAGDEIATIRVKVPDQFRFEKYYEFNKKCCNEEPPEPPPTETTQWLPVEDGLDGLFGPQDDFRFSPHFRYRFDFKLRYRFADEDDD